MPVRSDLSATRAERLDERTAEKVAAARTKVPPAVANDEIVCQSATHPGYAGSVLAGRFTRDIGGANGLGGALGPRPVR